MLRSASVFTQVSPFDDAQKAQPVSALMIFFFCGILSLDFARTYTLLGKCSVDVLNFSFGSPHNDFGIQRIYSIFCYHFLIFK